MGSLSRWAVLSPKKAIAAWFAGALIIGALAANFAGSYSNSFNLPDTESSRAQTLLEQIPGAGDALTAATAKIVWKAESGTATDPAVAGQVSGMLQELSSIPSVICVTNPYGDAIGSACPPAQPVDPNFDPSTIPPQVLKVMAGLGSAGFSTDQMVGYATVTFEGDSTNVPTADAKSLLDIVEAAHATDTLIVGANGQVLEFAGQEPPSSEAIGITVALIILLFTFGSLVGAFLPVISAIIALGVGQAAMLLVANALDVATFAPTLAAMIGLGVGIDYALFVVNRYKQDLDHDVEPREAALEAARSAGRSVFFAALTVIIGLLGLFVMRINFFDGLAVASAVTVLSMMVGATVLLPAVLSLLGHKAFALKMPWARNRKPKSFRDGAFAKYGAWLHRFYKPVGALALVVLIAIASPVASLRLGFSDDSGKPEGKPARVAYDLLSEGFGPGINGSFILAVESETAGNNADMQMVAGRLGATEGVAAVIPFPMGPDSNISAMQLVPTTGPQDEGTADLLDRLRTEAIPAATEGTALSAFVGGTTAITADFTTVLVDALPLFLTVVIGLGFLALVILFRSILVPLTGAITSLISLSAALGVTVAVFQWGWAADLIGLNGTGPIMPFLPIMVFAILFGLSMDYQVFLVSAMQEMWNESHDDNNDAAIQNGLASSGRVVAIAAAIMFSVFSAFILGSDSTIKLFGLALSTAVLFDAFIVRLIIVPSLMFTIGKANWWLPSWLKRALPEVKAH